jgi:hypothetical protein
MTGDEHVLALWLNSTFGLRSDRIRGKAGETSYVSPARRSDYGACGFTYDWSASDADAPLVVSVTVTFV